jgi:ABC-2 type transport system permease protein
MWERVWHMLKKEFIQVLQDRRTRGVIFGTPLIQLIVFGYAVTTDVRNVTLGVQDRDMTVMSREVVDRFVRSGYFTLQNHIQDDGEVRRLLDSGDVQAVLTIPEGFQGDIHSGRTAKLQLVVDGSDSNTASVVLQYAQRIVGALSREMVLERVTRAKGVVRVPGQIELESRAWFNENLESRNFFVPGVIATIVTIVTLMLTSMAVVREKEVGTMEQLIVTPITPWEFILGKTLPFALISMADVILVTTVGVIWFQVPVRGSILLLLGCTAIYLLTALGVGLLISTISRTQQQAMMTTFFFFMPAIMLSGLMFPIANMPEVVQWITHLNPMRYYLVVIRGIFLKGVGIDVLWPQMAALGVLGIATFWMASRRFRKTLS